MACLAGALLAVGSTACETAAVPEPASMDARCLPTRGCNDDIQSNEKLDSGVGTGADAAAGVDATPDAEVDAGPADSGADAGLDVTPDAAPPDAGAGPCDDGLSGWQVLGGAIEGDPSPGSSVESVDLAMDGDDPVVVWLEGTPAEPYVARWTGTRWASVGAGLGRLVGDTRAYAPAIDARLGRIAVAFPEWGGSGGGTRIYALFWTGTNWTTLGDGDLAGAAASVVGLDIALDDLGRAVLAFSEGSPRRIRVLRLLGNTAEPLDPRLGGAAGAGSSAITPRYARHPDGRLAIGFAEDGVFTAVRTASDDGWQPWGSALSPLGGRAHTPRFAREGAAALLAENDGTASRAFAMIWDGQAWLQIGGALDALPGATHSYPAGISVDPAGQPTVAWTESPDNSSGKLYARRWTGSAFVDLGALPLSAYAGQHEVVSAALRSDTCGRPVLAFVEGDGGDRFVHVWRYHGR